METMRRLLLVDDDPNDVELALSAMARSGRSSEIAVARDGEEALDMLFRRGRFADLEGGPPAVVVLDLKMPKVDGIEVLRQIRADGELGLLPVVVLTSSRQERDIVEAYSLGASSYIAKPLDFSVFVDVLHQIGRYWSELNVAPPGARRPGEGAVPAAGSR